MRLMSNKRKPVTIPAVAASKSLTIDPAAYARLLKVVRAEIAAGKKLIAQTMAVTNWKVGKYISDFILKGKDRAGYGEHVYEKLVKDLDIDRRTLEQSVQFSREFPITRARTELTWSHYRALLGLSDSTVRLELVQKSVNEKLNTRQLRKEVTRYKTDHNVPANEPIPKLTVERGKLYTYRSVQVKTPSSSKGKAKEVRIDCGFNVWRTIELATPQKIKADTMYTSVKSDDGNYRLAPAKVNVSEIFTYQAQLERLIDADTPIVVIDCGFKTESLQTLRLRGIDAPELNTRLGRKAKRFVEKLLKPCPFIVVKTYKDRSDKYDRYLVDIYFKPGELDPNKVAAEGELLNQKLLDAGLAKWYKW